VESDSPVAGATAVVHPGDPFLLPYLFGADLGGIADPQLKTQI
jgi:hypothetical protein